MPYQESPIDVAVQRIAPSEVAAFTKGCQLAYRATCEIDPDVIFLPERGAGPIRWAFDVLEDASNKSFCKVSLPLGTHIVVETGQEGGLTKNEKRLVVQYGVEKALNLHGEIKRPLLIDEVQTGSTLKTAAIFLSQQLQEMGLDSPLYVIALQDNRNCWLTQKKAHGFKRMITNNRPHIRAQAFEVPLFATDRQVFLNHILHSSAVDLSQRPRLQKIVYNVEAALFVGNLVLAASRPKEFQKALNLADSGEEIGAAESGEEARISLCRWIRRLIAADNGSIRSETIMKWFSDYAALIEVRSRG